MPHPAPDHALRRIVADLAVLHADDVAAVLGELDAAQRQTVEGLLRDYAAYFDPAQTQKPEDRIGYDASQLSPWLVQRLQTEGQPDFEMTAQARQALHDCAVRLYPAPATRPKSRGRMASVSSAGRP